MDDRCEGAATATQLSGKARPEAEREKIVIASALATMGAPEHFTKFDAIVPTSKLGARKLMMGDDPALPKMSAAPTLFEFFEKRLVPHTVNHMLQSANLALKSGVDEKGVLACLLHDISVAGLIQGDHGYWGAQLVEPYVDEEVAFAIRYHQALRFFPDPEAGYEYPQIYRDLFGDDYKPEPYIVADYEYARNHKWYGAARMITLERSVLIRSERQGRSRAFTDIVGRHFRQPKEGLGFDNSPVAHMWRAMIWPRNFL